MKRHKLSFARQIIKAYRNPRGMINKKEYAKGRRAGSHDAFHGFKFGTGCRKITYSFCMGYYFGWRARSVPARNKHSRKRFLEYLSN